VPRVCLVEESLSGGRKFRKYVHNVNENPNSPLADKIFFPNLKKVHNLYILMDFYLACLFLNENGGNPLTCIVVYNVEFQKFLSDSHS
jgi:hypothetical protein